MVAIRTALVGMTSFALFSAFSACGGVDIPPGTGGAGGAPASDAGVVKDGGKCTYDDPTKTYVSRVRAQCFVILYACENGTRPFMDACGCGCQTEPTRCEIPECFRAVNCVTECGGPILSSSCCPCPKGTFDDIVCRAGTN
jgi:hypothetical protein